MTISTLTMVLLLGCGDDALVGSTADSGTSTEVSGTMTATEEADTTTDPDTTTMTVDEGTAEESGEPIDGGQCMWECQVPADCCPFEGDECPGPFPFNWACDGGLCVPPACGSDTDCGDTNPPLSCLMVDGHPTCVTPCDDDPGICVQPNTNLACTGTADDGTSYCFEPCGVFITCEPGECDPESGLCVCNGDAQCFEGSVCVR